ncbi:MAG: VOC family protein [Stackebrandtia sp.]
MTTTGIDFVGLQSRDVEALAAFYEKKLGLKRAPVDRPGAVVFGTEPIPFAIREPLPGVDLDANKPGVGIGLWFKTDAPQELHDSLAADGVPILVAPTPGPFGLQFTFKDPEGYVITVHGES